MTKDLRNCCEYIASRDRMTSRGRRRSARREKAEAIMVKHAMAGLDRGMSTWGATRYARTKALAEAGLMSPQMWWLILFNVVRLVRWVVEWRKRIIDLQRNTYNDAAFEESDASTYGGGPCFAIRDSDCSFGENAQSGDPQYAVRLAGATALIDWLRIEGNNAGAVEYVDVEQHNGDPINFIQSSSRFFSDFRLLSTTSNVLPIKMARFSPQTSVTNCQFPKYDGPLAKAEESATRSLEYQGVRTARGVIDAR